MAAGWLFPLRSLPIYSFSQEWLSCALFFSIFIYCQFFKNNSSQGVFLKKIPSITAIALIIPIFGMIQIVTGYHPQPLAVGFFVCGFLAFFFSAQLGINLATNSEENNGHKKFINGFSIILKWILWSGVLSALIVFMQLLDWDIYFFPLIRSPSLLGFRPSANLSQPNLMTLQLVFAIISAGWLYIENKLPSKLLAIVVLFIAAAVIFANTRAYLLMLAPVIIGSAIYRGKKRKVIITWSALVLPGFYIFIAPFHQNLMEFFGHSGRGAFVINTNTDARVKIWLASIDIIKNHPFVGIGLGAYSTGFFEAAQSPLGSVGATGNAHNFVLQLMAECGVVIGFIFSIGVAYWYFKQFFHRGLSTWEIASFSIVGAALAHNLVEFPLWFFSFLIPVAFFAGLASTDAYFSICRISKKTRTIILTSLMLLASAGIIWSLIDFLDLQDNYENGITIGNSETIEKIKNQSRFSLFQWHYQYGKFLTTELNEKNGEELMDLGRKAVKRFPFVRGLARYAYISTVTNHTEEAEASLNVFYWMYPEAFVSFLDQNKVLCAENKNIYETYCALSTLAEKIKFNKPNYRNDL